MTKSRNQHGNEESERESKDPFLILNNNVDDSESREESNTVTDTTTTSSESEGVVDEEIVCGFGSFKPPWLQRCKTIVWFTGFYSIASFLTSALSVYVSSQITTLERYYNFSSSMSGFIMSCNDIGYLLTTLVMSYYSRRVHIPRGLSLSTFVYGVSGIVCVLAFAVTKDKHVGPGTLNADYQNATSGQQSFDNLCVNTTLLSNTTGDQQATTTVQAGDMPTTWKYVAITIIAVGMAIQGMAKSPRHPFLGTFIDDNVPKTKTTKYLGIISGTGIFGPAFAYMLGAVFSRIYVTLEDPGIPVRDPRWVGAWWLGYLVFGGVAILAALPIACFPRHLEGRRQLEGVESQKRGVASHEKKSTAVAQDFKGFLKSLGRLLTNPVYSLIVLGISVKILGVAGYYAFSPKYMEAQFTVPVFKANMTFGILNVMSAALGSMLGGYMVSRLKMSPVSCVKFNIVCSSLSTLCLSMAFVFGCDQPYIHKANDVLSHQNLSMVHCAADCNCGTQDFFPICGSDGRNYFSPCHAGCTDVLPSNIFVNCSCILGTATDTTLTTINQTATAGLCTPDCDNFYPFAISMFFYAFIACLTILPSFVIYVRAVSEKDKPLALGFLAFCTATVGWLPGPVIFGYIVDTSCELWNGKGACVLYNLANFRLRFYLPMMVLRLFAIITVVAVLLIVTFSKSFKFQSQQDDGIIDVKKNNDVDVDSDESIRLNPYDTDRAMRENGENGF